MKSIKNVIVSFCMALFLVSCKTNNISRSTMSLEGVDVEVIPLTVNLVETLHPYLIQLKDGTPTSTESNTYNLAAGDEIYISLSIGGGDAKIGELQQVYPVSKVLTNKNTSHIIDYNGQVTLPYINAVDVAGKTSEQAAFHIRKQYKTYFKNPVVSVKVLEYNSQYATIVGEVKSAGEIAISNRPLSIVAAINKAGGVTERAALEYATITNQNGYITPINLRALLHGGAAHLNHILQAGDTLYIPYSSSNLVYVTGETNNQKPVTIPLGGSLTLAEALYTKSGPHPIAGDSSQIYVIRGIDIDETSKSFHAEKPTIYAYHLDSSSPAALALAARFPLASSDVIYVGTEPVTTWSRFISQIIPQNITALLGMTTVQ